MGTQGSLGLGVGPYALTFHLTLYTHYYKVPCWALWDLQATLTCLLTFLSENYSPSLKTQLTELSSRLPLTFSV